jgi:hypothetical protein
MADYIRDLRPAKWGSGVSLHSSNPEPLPLCAKSGQSAVQKLGSLLDHLVGERQKIHRQLDTRGFCGTTGRRLRLGCQAPRSFC